jgi:hypothetical protein
MQDEYLNIFLQKKLIKYTYSYICRIKSLSIIICAANWSLYKTDICLNFMYETELKQ